MKILLEQKENWNSTLRDYSEVVKYQDVIKADLGDYFAMGSFRFVCKARTFGAYDFLREDPCDWLKPTIQIRTVS